MTTARDENYSVTSFLQSHPFKTAVLSATLLGCALTLLPDCSRAGDAAAIPHVSAAELAREVVRNELNAQDQDRSLWKYRQIVEKDGKTLTFEIVETREGEVHRLLLVDGEPLSVKGRQSEDARIENLLANPHEFQDKQKNAQHDAEQSRTLLKLLPQAFLYEYDRTEGELVKLKFRPNPDFHATNHESEVFHHMEGSLVVDQRQDRLAELDGRLVTPVKFWDGLLGHLDKGGTFCVKQRNVGGGHWEMTELDVQMSGKALLFKMVSVREKRIDSDFKPLPEHITLKQAEELLAVNSGN